MPVANQKYAFVTEQGWESSLFEKWPDAPLVGDYRLLVFAGAELPKLEAEYADVEFKYLSASKTIEQMTSVTIGPFICNIEQAREVAKHFTKDEISEE